MSFSVRATEKESNAIAEQIAVTMKENGSDCLRERAELNQQSDQLD